MGIAGAVAASQYGAPYWAGAVVFVLVYWTVTEVVLRRAPCPRCAANLWDGDKAPVGVKTRGVWFDPRGLPERCGACGLDLTASSFADFRDDAARARWENGNTARKTDGRRGRTFGPP